MDAPASSSPIRVARIITRLNIGGPAIQAAMLSDRLRPSGFDTLLIHGRVGAGEGDMSYLLDGRDVPARYVRSLQRPVAPASEPIALAAVLNALTRFKPHIVHTHLAKAGTIGRVAAAIYNRFARVRARTVHTYHGHVLEGYFRYAGAFVGIERALARVTDRLVAISPQIAAELQGGYRIGGLEQYRVIPLGFDLAGFAAIGGDDRRAARASLGLSPDPPVVTIVGRLTAIKQHDLFLRVAKAVHDRLPSALFLIVGDGERRDELERLAATLGLASAVRFLGWRRDLAAIYAATDVCALTSRNEGTPVALIEALAAGVPVVSTAVGGVCDVVNDRALGGMAPDGDVEALAALVLRELGTARRDAALVRARRASVLQRFSFDRLASDVAMLYRSLIAPDVGRR